MHNHPIEGIGRLLVNATLNMTNGLINGTANGGPGSK